MVKLKKRYRAAGEVADLTQRYPIAEAVGILAKMPPAKFDESVELSVHLGVDPRHSDQMVRGLVNLPHGSGKKITVAAFTEQAEEALAAGADFAGLDDLIAKIQDGWRDFEVAVATPAAMKKVRAIARILGPRGLMPNPKSGTVRDDVGEAIKEIKLGGRVEYKIDKTANIGVLVGKRSFAPESLIENIETVVKSLGNARPKSLKGKYILSLTISSTMSPGIRLEDAVFSQY